MVKFTVMFKMPSAASDAIRQALKDGELSPSDEKNAEKACEKFFPYDEYAYIEIDTATKTARVCPTKEMGFF